MTKLLWPVVLFLILAFTFSACEKDIEQVVPVKEVVFTESQEEMTIETLSAKYFDANPDEIQHQAKLIEVTNAFFLTLGATEEFSNKQPAKIQPIYAYGIDGVAYYEVWFTEDNKTIEGWILVSTTEKDLPLVNFSMGKPYSSNMTTNGASNEKIYRFGVSYFAMERDNQKVAEFGAMPKVIFNSLSEKSLEVNSDNGSRNEELELEEGVDYFTVDSYESLKKMFPQHYFSDRRTLAARNMKTDLLSPTMQRSYQYRWVGGQQCYYTQIPANSSSNWTACWAGCNNNAWANVYGWFDRNRGKSRLIPTTSTGETSPIYRTTAARQAVVDPVQMYTYIQQGTYCNNGGGWTSVSNAYKGYRYATSKNYGYSYHSYWGSNSTLANIVTEGIANRGEPVLVGANSHMYVGYGWAQNPSNTDATWAYCYPGWATNNAADVWIWWDDFIVSTRMSVY